MYVANLLRNWLRAAGRKARISQESTNVGGKWPPTMAMAIAGTGTIDVQSGLGGQPD